MTKKSIYEEKLKQRGDSKLFDIDRTGQRHFRDKNKHPTSVR